MKRSLHWKRADSFPPSQDHQAWANKKAEGGKAPLSLKKQVRAYFVLNVLTSLSDTPPFPSLATTFQ
jgi:hypothetical protein